VIRMANGDTVDLNENLVILAARIVREYYYPKRSLHSPDWILVLSIRELLQSHPQVTPEGLFDLLITESKLKSKGDLSRYLVKSLTDRIMPSRLSVFRGLREFSFDKLTAMVSLLTPGGRGICKTKLNQLLFYSDFTNFFIYGQSISGSKYIRTNRGPLMNRFDDLLEGLEFAGIIRVNKTSNKRIVRVREDRPAADQLSFFELVTMHWVNANFGSMTTFEIMEYSRREVAHRFTRQGDFIAYEYARLLQGLPGKQSNADTRLSDPTYR